MTGRTAQAKAIFLSALMVLSVLAIGGAGFAGTVAADSAGSAATDGTPSGLTGSPGESNVTVQKIQFSDSGSNGPLNVTNATVSLNAGFGAVIEQLYIYNGSQQVGTGQLNETIEFSSNVTAQEGATVDVTVTADLNGSAGVSPSSASLKTEVVQLGSVDGGTVANESASLVASNALSYDIGSSPVYTFDQANKDERVKVNASFTTPAASSQGVNESTITLAIDNQFDRNILVVKNGQLTANATAVDTDFDNGGNVSIDADVEVPEDSQGNYTLDLDSNVQDDGGNTIVASNSELDSSGKIDVDMYPAKLEVEPDESVFANADGDTAAADENATVNVTVVDRFGNGIRDSNEVNASVSLTSNDNSVSITNTSVSDDTLGTYNGTPFQFGVVNTEAEDITLNAFDTDAQDSSLNSGSGVQTFVGQIAGVDVSMNKSTLFADGNDAAEAQLQLVDANGDAVAKGGVSTSFSFNNGSAAGLSVASSSSQSPTTNSSGVATVAFTADTQGVTVTATGFEQQTANQYSDSAQITTTAGDVAESNTKFYFNGDEVSGAMQDVDGTVQVNTDHDVAVQVNDQNDNTIEGETVSYTLDGTEVASAQSGSDGFANATITLPTEIVESAALNASVGPFNASATGDAQVNVTSKAANATELSVDDTSIATGNSKTVTVSLLDEFGNLNASSTDVTLATSDSSVISVDDGEDASVTTNDGEADFTLTAEATEGSATLTASADGVDNDTATVTIAEVGGITLTPDSDSIAVDGVAGASNSTNFTAQVTDADGNAIEVNRTIRFTNPSGSAAESTGAFQVYAGDDGKVTSFRANATSETGETEFRARIPGTSYDDRVMITTTGGADALTVEAAESQAAVGDNVQVNLSVVDTDGRIVPIDSTDYFDVDTTLGTLDESDSTVSLDATAGEANVTLNGTEAGTASVNVFNSDIGEEADTTVEFVEDTSTLDVELSEQSITANTETDVTVTVTDNETGDAVEDASVSISDLQQSNTTDANGEAVFTVNVSEAGDYPVDISADGYEDASATLTVQSAGDIPEDAVYEPGSTAAEYDGDGDGQISLSELGVAGSAYANDELSLTELGSVGAAYANSGN